MNLLESYPELYHPAKVLLCGVFAAIVASCSACSISSDGVLIGTEVHKLRNERIRLETQGPKTAQLDHITDSDRRELAAHLRRY